MKKGLKTFRNLISQVENPEIQEEEKLTAIASYLSNDSREFADEVAARIEALEQISAIAQRALGNTSEGK